jgi:hypothetical protein
MISAAGTSIPDHFFGGPVRCEREQPGPMHEDLAVHAGVLVRTIDALERGDRWRPYLAAAYRLLARRLYRGADQLSGRAHDLLGGRNVLGGRYGRSQPRAPLRPGQMGIGQLRPGSGQTGSVSGVVSAIAVVLGKT